MRSARTSVDSRWLMRMTVRLAAILERFKIVLCVLTIVEAYRGHLVTACLWQIFFANLTLEQYLEQKSKREEL